MHEQKNQSEAEQIKPTQGWEHGAGVASGDDPLLDCLVMLTRIHERPLSHQALRSGLPLEDDKFTPELFIRAAQRANLTARVVKRPLHEISTLVLPAVLLLKGKQACILKAIDSSNQTATILQSENGFGEQAVSWADLNGETTGFAIFLQAQHQFDERAPEMAQLRHRHWFWGAIFSSWRIYRDVLVASFLINLFALASPLFIMNVYDRVVPNNAVETLWVLAAGITIVFVFDLLMRTLRGYFIDLAGKKSDILISSAIFEKVLGIKMEDRPPSVGAFANNLRDFESVRDFITSATVTTLVDLPFVILYLAVIYFIGGPIVTVALCSIALILLYGLIIQSPLRKSVEATFRASAQKGATLIEALTGVETIKYLGAESTQQRRWEQLTAQIAKWGVRSRLLSASAVNISTFLQQLSSVAVVIFGVYLITEGELSMGGLIAAVMLTGRSLGPMGQVANLAVRYFNAKTAFVGLESVMSLPVERPEGKAFISRESFKGELEFDKVSFAYPGEERQALVNVSFKVKAGERVAIIGRVGSGKTTIEKLMQCLYQPTEGAVRVDGIDVRQIDPADLRRNIGYVPQDIMLFYGSVKENITMGAPHAADTDIIHAADIAGVTEFVHQHPHGFDLQVGERGESLSGGQRQSVAVARALLMDSPILLMDEPSNSMDNATEEILKQRLASYVEDKTLLLITHRASLLSLVDRLIVVEAGQIIADGPKATVLEALKQGKLRGIRGA